MQRRSLAAQPISVVGVGNGGIEELQGQLDDASVSWALVRFQVGGTSKYAALHFNGDDVPTVKRGRLNARTPEVLGMFGEPHAQIEVKRKADVTTELLCERMLPIMEKVSGNATSSQLKDDYLAAVASCKASQPKDAGASNAGGVFTAQDRPDLGVTAESGLKAVGGQQGQWNWILMEPTKLELHNAGFGGIDEMKKFLDPTKVQFGLVRFAFGRADAQCGQAFVPGIVKHVFVHFVGNKVPVVKRGQWNAKQKEAEAKIKSVCAPMFRKEIHTEEEADLEDIVKELQRLSIAANPSSQSDITSTAKISVEDYKEALAAEMKDAAGGAAGGGGSTGSSALPDAKQAVDTVKAASGQWNWVLMGAAGAAPAAAPAAGASGAAASSPPAPATKAAAAPKKEADASAERADKERSAERVVTNNKEADASAERADKEKKEAAPTPAAPSPVTDGRRASKAMREADLLESLSKANKGDAELDAATKKAKEEAEKEEIRLAAEKKAAEAKAAAAQAAADTEKAAKEKAEKEQALKEAEEKAKFDKAVEEAANKKVEEALAKQRKTLIAEAQQAAVEAAKAALASEQALQKQQKDTKEDSNAAAGDSGSNEDKFSLQKPCPADFLGAFDCLATEETKQLGWFSSSMPPDEVLVVQVEANSWAETVGLKTGDELMEVQGKEVSSIDQKEFIEFMHKRPLTLSFFRQEGAREKMLARGSLPAQGRGSTPLRPSVVNRLNSREDVRQSFVERQNKDVNTSTPSRTSKVVQSFPQWEDYTGELHIRSGWAWKRRFFQLAQGHLRWWKQKDQYEQKPQPAPEVDLCLVGVNARWKVEALKGSRFELNHHPATKLPPRTTEEPKEPEKPKEPKERKSLLERASNRASKIGAKIRESSVGSSSRSSSQDPSSPGKAAVPQYLIAADDTASATEWARAIWHHVAYVDMLSLWPMPLEGRQGDIKFYGIEQPQ